MSVPATINPQIIEALYCEALVLADEVRTCFTQNIDSTGFGGDEDLAKVARSCEGLRTTTRMMHAVAWLLNQRSYFMGELTEYQLRRHGRLAHEPKGPDASNLQLLDSETIALIEETDRFYSRLLRLDREWRRVRPLEPNALHDLQDRMFRVQG